MASAPGLRDQRIRVYELKQNSETGFPRPLYSYLYTLWGRLDVKSDQQRVPAAPQAHTEYRERAKASFSYASTIPRDGLLKVGDEVYFVRGVTPRRALWRTEVDCERIDTQQFAEFSVFEGDDVTDGVHLVTP